MSVDLQAAIDNASDLLDASLDAYVQGTLRGRSHVHAIGLLFRQLGVCRLLLDGVAEPMFVCQAQAASAYVFGLPRLPDDDKVTSLAACFWDAVAGTYWDAARDIARVSRRTHHPDREHEDDFIYVAFLMTRYFPQAFVAEDVGGATPAEVQTNLLDRWDAVLAGGVDPKLDLCRALMAGDATGFATAFAEVGAVRTKDLARRHARGTLAEEQFLWLKPFWMEGLALLRLAEREGIALDEHYPMIPSVARVPNPYAYDPAAFRTLGFRPKPRGA